MLHDHVAQFGHNYIPLHKNEKDFKQHCQATLLLSLAQALLDAGTFIQ